VPASSELPAALSPSLPELAAAAAAAMSHAVCVKHDVIRVFLFCFWCTGLLTVGKTMLLQ